MSAGLFQKYHNKCKIEHDKAVAAIPNFFTKILTSTLPAERFSELLHQIGETAHIKESQLRSLFFLGVRVVIDDVLKTRLLTTEEEERLYEIIGFFGQSTTTLTEESDHLLKVSILRDISERGCTEKVAIGGDLPFHLAPSESIIWVFNRTRCFRSHAKQRDAGLSIDFKALAASAIPTYYPRQSVEMGLLPHPPASNEGTGDLIFTNRRLLFLAHGRVRRTPFHLIESINSATNGVKIITGRQASTRTYLVDDPWFATNIMLNAVRLLRSKQETETIFHRGQMPNE
jgi:hypothetical protein